MNISQAVEAALGKPVRRVSPMGGGCVGMVFAIELHTGTGVVAKVDESALPRLEIEGRMLRFLRSSTRLPVPEVLYCAPELLLMERLPGASSFDGAAQEHAAELLVDLHGIAAPRYGFECDTLIGGLHQPNQWRGSWIQFFQTQRLMYMAGQARDARRLPDEIYHRVERFSGELESYLLEPDQPSLVHGDVWTTNVLAQYGKITGFIDPALYFAHPEIELAFITLFNTFGPAFFRRYQESRPPAPGFFEERRDIYNLYPLLVHVRLFGGSYVSSVEATLRRFGF